MKKCCLLFAVLLFPLMAMADYELDWPEEDIEESHASCIQSAFERTGRLDASGLEKSRGFLRLLRRSVGFPLQL